MGTRDATTAGKSLLLGPGSRQHTETCTRLCRARSPLTATRCSSAWRGQSPSNPAGGPFGSSQVFAMTSHVRVNNRMHMHFEVHLNGKFLDVKITGYKIKYIFLFLIARRIVSMHNLMSNYESAPSPKVCPTGCVFLFKGFWPFS